MASRPTPPGPSQGAILGELRRIGDLLALDLALHRSLHAGWTRTANATTFPALIFTNRSHGPLAVSIFASDLGEAGMATWLSISAHGQGGAPTRSWRLHVEDRRLDLILLPGEEVYDTGSNGTGSIFVAASAPFDLKGMK